MPGRLHSYTVKMKAEVFSDTSLTTYQTTRHRIPRDTSPHYFSVKNLNFENFGAWFFFFAAHENFQMSIRVFIRLSSIFLSHRPRLELFIWEDILHPLSDLKVCL